MGTSARTRTTVPGRGSGDVHRFRLALADLEALRRAKTYLAELDVQTKDFVFHQAVGNQRGVSAIRTSARRHVEPVRDIISWPRYTSVDWCKGFLAGIFDAEGSYGGVIRIANTDQEIIDWTTYCLRRLGFPHVVERTRQENGLANVRITGGLVENLRFFQAVNPAITRKRSIEGTAIKCNAKLG